MRALILWAEPSSKNLGVRALSEGTAQLLRNAFPGVTVEQQGFGPGDAPVRIGSSRAQMRRLVSRRDELTDWTRSFDVVVDTRAGDSFADIYGRSRLWTMTLMAAVVARAKVPLVLGPQTIGPFQTPTGKLLARANLRMSTLVMARDELSLRASAAAGRPADVLTTDVVFALDRPHVDQTRDVIVNVSGLLWSDNTHVDSEQYRSVVRETCRALLTRGRRVSLLAHVLDSPLIDNDVPVATRLAEELGSGVEVLVPAGLADAREMLASAQAVVGSRMHACLNALSVGRPAVPLAYSRKFHPLLDALGWPYTIDLRESDSHAERVLAVLDDPGLERGVATVRERAADLVGKAEDALKRTL